MVIISISSKIDYQFNLTQCVLLVVKPEITLPNRRLGQGLGRETILECIITAFPQAVTYWEKGGRQVTSSLKHRIEAYDEGDNTLVLSLRINDLEDSDYGEYKCIASNSLGKDAEVMFLYGIHPQIFILH